VNTLSSSTPSRDIRRPTAWRESRSLVEAIDHLITKLNMLRLAQRQGRGLLLVFADLDGLKAINDGLGHEQGDAAIRDFAGVMRGAFRVSDIVARLGGDEFVALAYDASADDAAKVEARVTSALEEFNATSKRAYRLAASVGTTILAPGDALTLEQLVIEADRAMYERKRAKRGT